MSFPPISSGLPLFIRIFGPEAALSQGAASAPLSGEKDVYLVDPPTSAFLSEIERRSPDLVRRDEAFARLGRRRSLLRGFMERAPFTEALRAKDIVRSFRLLGDPYSLRVAQAIEGAEFRLLLADHASFDSQVADLVKKTSRRLPLDSRTQNAVYFPSGLIEERAILAVRIPPIGLAPGLRPEDILFEILATLVHEFQHHEDIVPEERRTAPVVFRLELRGHAREFLWRAEHGDTGWLEAFTVNAPTGFALRFRDHFDRHYGPRFRGTPSK